ncbi:MAG: galactokinase family protein [Gemmatimonadota bacterium]
MTAPVASLDTMFVRMSMADAGFTPRVHDAYMRLVREAHRALDESAVPRDGRRVWIVPGRIEVLGKHVDYAGGRSLLCTVQRGIVIVARGHEERTIVLRDARRREALTVPFDGPPQASLPWTVYPKTVLHRLQLNFDDAVRGADIAIASNLPPAAGVSSSSALVVGLTLALSALSNLPAQPAWKESIPDRLALAGYVGALENGIGFRALPGELGVGTMGGAQDQTAILCCAPGQLDVFAWSPVRHERTVPWPTGFSFVIGVSGVVAAKTGAAKDRYNRAARTVHRLVDLWNRAGGSNARTLANVFEEASGVQDATAVPDALLALAKGGGDEEFSGDHLQRRLRQFHDETYRLVPGAADALARGALDEFGTLVAASQLGAERALENQIVETVSLVRLARELGAVASSAFGAGFGGSVWAMVPTPDADRFATAWRDRYGEAHRGPSRRAQFFTTEPSAPAFELQAADPVA